MRNFISLLDISEEVLDQLIHNGMRIAQGKWTKYKPLQDKIVSIYFRKPSTRTRSSFTAGAITLGASTITYGPNDLQVITGESLSDTARVLSCYIDLLVVRTNESVEEMKQLVGQSSMSVINAMSQTEHPTQVIGDLITIKEATGQLENIHILYIGEGNNTATALALAVSKVPSMHLTVITPEEYSLPNDILSKCLEICARNGSSIEQHHNLHQLPNHVDVVYTTRWQTLGVPHTDPHWHEKFEPYRVTPELMKKVSKPEGTIFMHDLPAIRGSEVVDEVLDGPQSLAFRQAYHKLTSPMSILTWCAEVKPPESLVE
ncbi:MAG: hypothetical protein KME40_10705 [Komarekiella atlantica HA4396-MV6]|jgi:ornithine carbamoyltransferase|nr:hypothetical protein [Komarekiella atlantica HA4396-MV6]